MEKPNVDTVGVYERTVPDDRRARRGQMFGHPCAFVNGHMFYGTFAQTIVARVGAERAASLAARGSVRVFEPIPGTRWGEYVQAPVARTPETALAAFAREALEWVAKLPPKGARGTRPKAARARPASPRRPARRRS